MTGSPTGIEAKLTGRKLWWSLSRGTARLELYDVGQGHKLACSPQAGGTDGERIKHVSPALLIQSHAHIKILALQIRRWIEVRCQQLATIAP